jgi:hypothetical protein
MTAMTTASLGFVCMVVLVVVGLLGWLSRHGRDN